MDIYKAVMCGTQDTNIRFSELCALLKAKGFAERVRGTSHHIFSKTGVFEIINLQADGAKAEAYQVKQVRILFDKYGLEGGNTHEPI